MSVTATHMADHWLVESDSEDELGHWLRVFTKGLGSAEPDLYRPGMWKAELPPDFWDEKAYIWARMEFHQGELPSENTQKG